MLTNFHLSLAQFGTFTLQLKKKILSTKSYFFSSARLGLEKFSSNSSLDNSLYKFRLDVSLCVYVVCIAMLDIFRTNQSIFSVGELSRQTE